MLQDILLVDVSLYSKKIIKINSKVVRMTYTAL